MDRETIRMYRQLKQEFARLQMMEEMQVIDDWVELTAQDRAVTLALIRRLAAEQRAKREQEAPPRLRLVVAAR